MTLESSKLQILSCVSEPAVKINHFAVFDSMIFCFCIAYPEKDTETFAVSKCWQVDSCALIFPLLEKGILLLQSVLNWDITLVSLWRNPILTLLILGTSLCTPDIVPVTLFHH